MVWMGTWGRGTWLVLLGVACGPIADEVVADPDATETDPGTAGDAGSTTAGAMGESTAHVSGADTTVAGSTADPPGDATADACPVGTEGCPCDVGEVCDDGLGCDDGTCVAPPACEHPETEPNDDEASAIGLPDLACDGPQQSVQGVLDGVDADWFTFHGDPGLVCLQGPGARVTADIDVVLCMYFECDVGTADVKCNQPANPSDSPEGRVGCCGTNGVGLGTLDCGVLEAEEGPVYIRVSSAEAVCMPYEIVYEF